MSALVFLELNQISVVDSEERLYDAMMAVADGRMDKAELARLLRQLVEVDPGAP